MAAPEISQKESEFEKLRNPIQEIIAFTNTLDERYREKCFEVLLEYYLHTDKIAIQPQVEISTVTKEQVTGGGVTLPLSIQGFLKTNNVPIDVVGKLYLIDNSEIVPTYKLKKDTMKATAQIQLALLSAFKNALANTSTMFEFSIEDVRTLCKEHGVYDGGNFMTNFKNSAALFKDFPGDEKHVKLTPDGKTELGKVLLAVASQ